MSTLGHWAGRLGWLKRSTTGDVHYFVQCTMDFWQPSHQDINKDITIEYNKRKSYEWSKASAVSVWFPWCRFLIMTEWWLFYSLTRNTYRRGKINPQNHKTGSVLRLEVRLIFKTFLLLYSRYQAMPTNWMLPNGFMLLLKLTDLRPGSAVGSLNSNNVTLGLTIWTSWFTRSRELCSWCAFSLAVVSSLFG